MKQLFKIVALVTLATTMFSACTTTYVVRSEADIPVRYSLCASYVANLRAQESTLKWLRGTVGENKQEYETRGGVTVYTPEGPCIIPYAAAGSRAGNMNPSTSFGGTTPCYNCGLGTGYSYNYQNRYWGIYR